MGLGLQSNETLPPADVKISDCLLIRSIKAGRRASCDNWLVACKSYFRVNAEELGLAEKCRKKGWFFQRWLIRMLS